MFCIRWHKESGSIVESALITLPLFSALIGIMWIGSLLLAVAQVHQEAVLTSVYSEAYLNSGYDASNVIGNTDQLFVNHQTPQDKIEAMNGAESDYGFITTEVQHLTIANILASYAQTTERAYGFTPSGLYRYQVIADFTPPSGFNPGDYFTVRLRSPFTLNLFGTDNIEVTASMPIR